MPSSTVNLPSSDSPHLRLVHPNEDEKTATWILNGQVWRGQLSLPAYLRREVHLANQPFTRHGGITYWILVDTSPASSSRNRTILASCESLRKRALVAREGQPVREVISHGIGSVFCDPAFRGKGYARRMLSELGKILDTWQQQDENKADFTVLFSDIGKVSDSGTLAQRTFYPLAYSVELLLQTRMESLSLEPPHPTSQVRRRRHVQTYPRHHTDIGRRLSRAMQA